MDKRMDKRRKLAVEILTRGLWAYIATIAIVFGYAIFLGLSQEEIAVGTVIMFLPMIAILTICIAGFLGLMYISSSEKKEVDDDGCV